MKIGNKNIADIIKTMAALFIITAGFLFVSEARAEQKPKNVIFMIADGGGFNHSLAAGYYEYGKADGQVYNSFPIKLAVSTYPAQSEYSNATSPPPVSQQGMSSGQPRNTCYDSYKSGLGYDPSLAWKDFSYVKYCFTDSAAAATALATGSKTYKESIGVDINRLVLENVIEAAERNGKSTGIITTKDVVDATPSAFSVHNTNRFNGNEISSNMINDSAVDVIIGAGNPFYDNRGILRSSPDFSRIRRTDWDALAAGTAGGDADSDGDRDPWVLIQDRLQFQKMANGLTPSRVFGIAKSEKTLQQLRDGDRYADPYAAPFNENEPTLEEMTRAALNVLDDDKDGFFLMIEGGAIDDASHAGQSGRMIEEYIDFERSVDAAVVWVNANSNWSETMLIVTADHETGYLNGPGSNKAQNWLPLVNNGKGVLPGMEWGEPAPPPGAPAGGYGMREHTNSLVPLWVKGGPYIERLTDLADQSDPVRGAYMDNTELGRFIKWAVSMP